MSFVPDSLPVINPAQEPAAIRNGGHAAQQAYQTGLAFEQMLVEQLSQELAATAGGSSDGSSSSDGTDTSGLMGSDPATADYAQLLPQALSSSVMSAGGLGIAAQIAGAIDPSTTGALSAPSGGAR
jgi:Rod binding domain-containing protein